MMKELDCFINLQKDDKSNSKFFNSFACDSTNTKIKYYKIKISTAL